MKNHVILIDHLKSEKRTINTLKSSITFNDENFDAYESFIISLLTSNILSNAVLAKTTD